MTMRKKWLLTIIGLVAIGAALSLVAVSRILIYSAGQESYEWLHGAYNNGTRAYHEQLFKRLEHDAHALQRIPEVRSALREMRLEELDATIAQAWQLKEPNEFWLVVTDSGRLLSSEPECTRGDLSQLRSNPRPRFILCERVAAMVAGSPIEGATWHFFVGYKLDEHYVDALQKLTATEITLLGPSGPLVTTIKDLQDRRVPPVLEEGDLRNIAQSGKPGFGKYQLRIPSYRGYLLATKPFDAGSSSVKSYVFAANVDIERGEIPVDIVYAVPAAILDLGAKYSLLAQSAITILILLILSLVAWILATRFTKPLSLLAAAAKRVGEGDLHVQVPIAADHELAMLGRAFNEMIEKLEESRAIAVQAEKMSAVGQLAGGVAHEINNPLGVILGFAQGMERRVPEGDALRLPVASIVREALRCRNLVQELLTFSRTAKKTTEEVDLNAVVRSTAVLLEARAKTQGVEVVQELHEPLPALRANKTQLQQVIVNLGTNAMDAMSGGGKLTLRTRLNGGGKAVLDVADTGTGIPEEVRARIFEPFFTTKEVGKGTGLGLSLVYEIIQQHQGKIAVESQPGKGTVMSVELRTAPAAADSAQVDTARAAGGGLQ